MAVDFRQFEKLLQRYTVLQDKHEEFLNKFLLEMGMRTIAQTKKRTPVDTGTLRNRWELSKVEKVGDSLEVTIFNPLEYASWIEDGHIQKRRFVKFEYLEDSISGRNAIAGWKAKYGDKSKGIMLNDKWIEGHHMARISITEIQKEIPTRYKKAFDEFLKGLEL